LSYTANTHVRSDSFEGDGNQKYTDAAFHASREMIMVDSVILILDGYKPPVTGLGQDVQCAVSVWQLDLGVHQGKASELLNFHSVEVLREPTGEVFVLCRPAILEPDARRTLEPGKRAFSGSGGLRCHGVSLYVRPS
jgi:hypothetical protein